MGQQTGTLIDTKSNIPVRILRTADSNIINQANDYLVKGATINPTITPTSPYAAAIQGPGGYSGMLNTVSFTLDNDGAGAVNKDYFIGYPLTLTEEAFGLTLNDPDTGTVNPAQFNAQFLVKKATVAAFNYSVTSVSQFAAAFDATTVTIDGKKLSETLAPQIRKARSAASLTTTLLNVVCSGVQPELSAERGLRVRALAGQEVGLDIDWGFYQS
jgi:hypothetical protein